MKKILLFLICSFVVVCQDNSSNAVFTGTFGSATINDKVYNQFSIRPELAFGNFGLGLDIYFYIHVLIYFRLHFEGYFRDRGIYAPLSLIGAARGIGMFVSIYIRI